jgi:1-acyl-sn-glycerol-3-phosphate acyltransferase
MNILLNIIKIIWIYLWAVIASCVLFVPIMLAALFSRTGNLAFTLSRGWAWIMVRVTGVRLSIRNRERIREGQSYIIISNHQSLYDILAIVLTLGIQFRWIIKKEVLKVPLFGYALYASRNIFIDRSDREKSVQSIHKGFNRLPEGVSVLFFAEGTRSPDETVRDFKKGGFVMAVERGLPILPLTVNGSRRVLKKGDLVFHPGPIEVVVGEPIDTTGYDRDSLRQLMDRTREVILGNRNPYYPGEQDPSF